MSNASRPTLAAIAALSLAVALLVSACGSSGRELREPERDVTSPTRSVPTTVASISLPPLPTGTGGAISTVATFPPVAPGAFAIGSSAFIPGGDIPTTYTCAGPSPALRWQGIPAGTAELALVVTEAGDRGDVHWMVTGIAPTEAELPEGGVPGGATQLTNSLGAATWSAPCPPPGQRTAVDWVLLALPQPASIPAGTPATDAYKLLTEQANGKIAVLTSSAIR